MVIEIMLAVIAFNTLAISYNMARIVAEMRDDGDTMT